jgi:hypothetical protein
MGYTRSLVSFIILTVFVGLGFLFLITDQANAGHACFIGIEKVADPADNTPFDFSAPGSNNPNFTLMDPSNVTDTVGVNGGQTVNVTEDVPAGWSFAGTVCTVPIGVTIGIVDKGLSFECTVESGGSVNCRYFNSKDCSIEIVKVADPADDTPFDFTVTGNENFGFTLRDPSAATKIIDVDGEVTVLEEVPPGWIFDKVECTESQGILINEIPNGITISCETPDEVATCTFTNVRAAPIPTLSEWGLIAMAGVLGIVGYLVIRRKKATA